MIRVLVMCLYPLFLGIWRRAFGCDCWNIPVLKNRFVLHIIGGAVAFVVCLALGYTCWRSLAFSSILQGLYWARAVGMYQDIGNGGQPDEKMLERYNNMWYNKFLDKWFSKYKYSDLYDFCGLTIRYTLPAILMAFILLKPSVALCGGLVACGYAFMWKLKNYGYIQKPTEWAECIAGFLTGFLLSGF